MMTLLSQEPRLMDRVNILEGGDFQKVLSQKLLPQPRMYTGLFRLWLIGQNYLHGLIQPQGTQNLPRRYGTRTIG